METVQGDNTKERSLFDRYARKYLPEMRLLFRGAKLSKKEGDWNNVIDHQLACLAATDVLSTALDLPEGSRQVLNKAALVHDWDQRLEKKPGHFTDEEKAAAKEQFEDLQADETLLEATGDGFSRTVINGNASFLQEILFYTDNICKGSEIVPLKQRLDEVEARRSDLNEDQELTRKLGGRYWDIERKGATEAERKIFEGLKAKGVDIKSQEEIPSFINQKVEEMLSV